MSSERLRNLIETFPGNRWDDKVKAFAVANGRSASSIYRWLSNGAPENVLDAIEHRLNK